LKPTGVVSVRYKDLGVVRVPGGDAAVPVLLMNKYLFTVLAFDILLKEKGDLFSSHFEPFYQ
jgi:hypothetical protein